MAVSIFQSNHIVNRCKKNVCNYVFSKIDVFSNLQFDWIEKCDSDCNVYTHWFIHSILDFFPFLYFFSRPSIYIFIHMHIYIHTHIHSRARLHEYMYIKQMHAFKFTLLAGHSLSFVILMENESDNVNIYKHIEFSFFSSF